ncbi:stromal interaction molecule 2-like isoform X1 [Osmerus eperlanus]|uniref:stromal interaction molecule 2-like isoform X1 n=1 Tax=Osmerus eperlanus TaxID=29151 RepID=UPI002E0FABAA
MMPTSQALLFILRLVLFVGAHTIASVYSDNHYRFPYPDEEAMFDAEDPCVVVTPPCMSESDRYSLEALRNIHREMDDDKDGGIEVEESVEFIIEDMKQQQTNKHSNLHREDQHITVEELWRSWKSSEVHNWTQDDVLSWLRDFVELPQYQKNFKEFRVDGNTLPRIAANEPSFLSGQLKIFDQRDKQKLNIKALDVVLFGPITRPPHNWLKDLLLMVSVMMGVGGCWFSRVQNKSSKIHISRMMRDLESLQSAELNLSELQEQLERAQEEKRNVAEEKQTLEEKMRDEIMGAQEEAHRLYELREGAVSELSRLRYAEEELEQVRGALKRAEKDMLSSWTVPEALQLWLQLTHEVEVQYYNVKKHRAELQLAIAKEEAEKIKKKRSSVLGTLHVAHSSCLDQVDQKIMEAKNSLSDVTACLRERLVRWQNIERLCGFTIIRNTGLASLTATLYVDANLVRSRVPVQNYSCHSSVEDLPEDSSPIQPQIPVPPIKRSPRSLSSTVCRSRRPGLIAQTSSMMSSDPDLLLASHAPLPCFEEEEATKLIRSQLRQEPQEMFTDADFMTSPPVGRIFPSAAVDSAPRKIYRDEADMFDDDPVRNTSREEPEPSVEPPICMSPREEVGAAVGKMPRDKMDATADTASLRMPKDKWEPSVDIISKKTFRDAFEVSVDSTNRKMLREEREASTKIGGRKFSRESMGGSMDSWLQQEECSFDGPFRMISRESIGVSMDTGFRKLIRDKDGSSDSTMRVMAKDKMVDPISIPIRKTSREELEFSTESLSRKMLPRDKMEILIDTSSRLLSREMPDFSMDSSAARKISRDELDMPASLNRRRIPRDMIDSSVDTSSGKISRDRVDVVLEMPKRRISREEFVVQESGSSSGRMAQPDLTLNSVSSWKPPFEPLSRLVYDGILEKCVSTPTTTTPTGADELIATAPMLTESLKAGEEDLTPLGVAATPHNPSPSGRGEKPKEKSKRTSKLKNLFKKKKDSASDRPPQGGLQKL